MQEKLNPQTIADIACGAGSLSYHLCNTLYPNAQYRLSDFNKDAIELAQQKLTSPNFKFTVDSIYELSFETDSMDIVSCRQTLSWLSDPEKALAELIKTCKSGGYIYLSSLFNIDHDVDIYSRVIDFTRTSSSTNLSVSYNTYSKKTISRILENKVQHFDIMPFVPKIDFEHNDRGLGTKTIKTAAGDRLQTSAGMLLNWGILKIIK